MKPTNSNHAALSTRSTMLAGVIASFALTFLPCTSASFAASDPSTTDEAGVERNFDSFIQPNDLRTWMKLLAAEPNHVGSAHDKANAEQILAWFKDWGWDAKIETFRCSIRRRSAKRSN